jgi:hypothetical protein
MTRLHTSCWSPMARKPQPRYASEEVTIRHRALRNKPPLGVRRGAADIRHVGTLNQFLRELLAWTNARRSSIKARLSRFSRCARSFGRPKIGVANSPRRFTHARHARTGTSHRRGRRGGLLAGKGDAIFRAWWSHADREGDLSSPEPGQGMSSRIARDGGPSTEQTQSRLGSKSGPH